MVSYRFNDDNKKVKTTRRIRTTVVKESVNPRVAERRSWPKFGLEKGNTAGPSFDTTSVGENIIFRPSVNWKSQAKEEDKSTQEDSALKAKLGGDKKVKCRICSGEHFTAKCPFKDTMAPVDEPTGGAGAGPGGEEDDTGGLGPSGSSYVPPHLRKGAAAGGERMSGKFERDDLATLRVTNVRSISNLRFAKCAVDANFLTGERTRGGARTSGSIREIWTRYESLPCKRPRDEYGQGLCVYQLCRPGRCCGRLREAGWL